MINDVLLKKIRYLITLISICIFVVGCTKNSGDSEKNQNEEAVVVLENNTQESEVAQDLKRLHEQQSDSKVDDDNTEFVEPYEKEISEFLNSMTIEEKVGQLFIIYPESLAEGIPCVTVAGDITKDSIDDIPVGGIVYLSQNLRNPEQVKDMLANTQQYSMERIGLPIFLCVDEEGGKIARIANNQTFALNNVGDMAKIGEINDTKLAFEAGSEIGSYLSELGFNLDFAPVVDVVGENKNSVIGKRSFSSDPDVVSDMSLSLSKGLESEGVISVFKHFPGHGSTVGDPHKGYAYTDKTLDELKQCDLIPFEKGVEGGISVIMVGHISFPNILKDETPASLSNEMVQELLRNDMGYDGIVITDAMNMGAVSNKYMSDEASVLAIEAGVDIVLMPKDFKAAYQGVLKAVQDGRISEKRIDESVRRILNLKIRLMEEKE